MRYKFRLKWYYLIYIFLVAALIFSFFIDQQVVFFFESLRIPFIDTIAIAFAELTDVYTLFIIVLALFILFKRKFIFEMLSASALALIFTFVLKQIFRVPRPEIITNIEPLIFEAGFSFPSGHTLFMFSLVPVFFFVFRKKGGFIWLFLSLIVLVSRLYLGVHFLSDVLFSVVLGLFIGKFSLHIKEVFLVRWKSLS